ncbi:MAG: hypothetical protein LBE12_08660 [Planctomycetaceae bacterium]|nr:hypothetical protein [Planctomycetaceae bacterium]
MRNFYYNGYNHNGYKNGYKSVRNTLYYQLSTINYYSVLSGQKKENRINH